MATKETHKLVCDGNTRANRDLLARRGWTWDASRGAWWIGLVDAHAARIPQDDEFFRGLGGHLKGCRLTLDGTVVWTSKTYAACDTLRSDAYACDQAGNYVPGKQIPGSAPDDRI